MDITRVKTLITKLGGTLTDRDIFHTAYFTYKGFSCGICEDAKLNKFTIQVYMLKTKHREANTYAADAIFRSCTTSIGVGCKKTDTQIVADINRRLDWDGELAKVKQAYRDADDAFDEHLAAHSKIVAHLQKVLGIDGTPHCNTATRHEFCLSKLPSFTSYDQGYGDIIVDGTSVDFKLRSYTDLDSITAICKAIRGS